MGGILKGVLAFSTVLSVDGYITVDFQSVLAKSSSIVKSSDFVDGGHDNR